jgi:hypothetical protein
MDCQRYGACEAAADGVDGADKEPKEAGKVGEGIAGAGEVDSCEDAEAERGDEKDSEVDGLEDKGTDSDSRPENAEEMVGPQTNSNTQYRASVEKCKTDKSG